MSNNQIDRVIDKINKNLMGKEERKLIDKVLKSGFLSRPQGGPFVKTFQSQIARWVNKKYAFAVNSGTSALHLSIKALNLKNSDEVIVPALANIADCSSVLQEGGKLVFADINPKSFNINPKDVQEKITKNTRAIICVHMYGEPAKIDEIIKISKKSKLVLIEDCAQSTGAKYKGKYVGSFGDISCFSFYQTKHIVCGEGGLVTTSNRNFAKIIDSVANNGIKQDNLDAYDYNRIGYNYQMSEIEAAIGTVQFKKLDKLNKIRRNNAEIYRRRLADTEIVFQENSKIAENSYFYLTGILPERLIKRRDDFLREVKKMGVPIKKLYPSSLPEIELLRNKVNNNCFVAKDITRRLFNLYVNPGLSKKDIELFCKKIKEAYLRIEKNEKSK